MDLLRRLTAGELSEVFGPLALESDRDVAAPAPAPDRRGRLHHHAARRPCRLRGLHARRQPVSGYSPRQPADRIHPRRIPAATVERGRFRADLPAHVPHLTTTFRDELLKSAMLADGDPAPVGELFPVRTGTGDAAGVQRVGVAGSRTASGKPLLSNDMHLEYSLPGIWYHDPHRGAGARRLGGRRCRARRESSSAITSESPGGSPISTSTCRTSISRRSTSAPGATSMTAGGAGARRARTHPGERAEPPGTVGLGDAPRSNRGRRRRRADVPTLDRGRTRRCFSTRFSISTGPATGRSSPLRSPRFTGPGSNFVYADVDGNIGYHAAGMLPKRAGYSGDVPVDGPTRNSNGTDTFRSTNCRPPTTPRRA